MNWFLLVLVVVLFIQVMTRLQCANRANSIYLLSQKSFRVWSSHSISDHWKEKVLPKYSLQLMSRASYLLGILLLAVSPVLFCHYLVGETASSPSFLDFMQKPIPLVLSMFVGVIYYQLRNYLDS